VTEILGRNHLKGGKKDLFWCMISEVSVHGLLDPLLSACGKAEHHGAEGIIE
jgi:hypothetical protein